MCGIIGYLGKKKPAQDNILNASKILSHRGPDGEGFYTNIHSNNAVVLIHRRLSIIDLKQRSNQPFKYKGTVLIYNGEIYNFLEIRKELEGLGHVFKTKSDTEVLIHSLYEWGEKALNRLEGMWAFAWYNEVNGSLFLARDRFGEKPLYIMEKDHGFYFSSEVKGIAALMGEWPKINYPHLLRGLINGYKSIYKVKETFFDKVRELPFSTFMIVKPDEVGCPQKYWKPFISQNNKLSYNESIEMIKEAVIKSIKLRMRSDVPIAFCMSGGVDSNTLISVASKILNCEVHGFTVANTDSRYEEQSLIEYAVKELQIKHTQVQVNNKDFIENLTHLIKLHDAPIATISYYLHWQLMKAIQVEGYKVTVSGTAADELFTGYYDHHNLYLYEISKDKKLFENSLSSWKKYQLNLVRNPILQNPELYIKNRNFRDHIYLNNDLFAKYLKIKWNEPFTEIKYSSDLLRNRMLNELFNEAVPVILHEDDLNAMSCSLENRSPFLDKNLFEKAYSIPTCHLIKDGKAKSVLRDAMRGIVPDKILNERRKVGFNASIHYLLDLEDLTVKEFLMSDSKVFELVSKKKIEKLLNQKEMKNSFSKFLFNFINMKIFIDNHEGNLNSK
jgi:asparagine synthase (glutamine-hydrolysing)